MNERAGVTTLIPSMMREEGSKQIQVAEDFGSAVKDLYNKLEELVTGGYVSPESLELKERIDGYRETLKNAETTIRGYGEFLMRSADDAERNSQEIMQSTNISF